MNMEQNYPVCLKMKCETRMGCERNWVSKVSGSWELDTDSDMEMHSTLISLSRIYVMPHPER